MLLKWILLLVFGYVAYRWWSRVSASSRGNSAQPRNEQMIACAHCGVNFPQSEAVISQNNDVIFVFCCDKHRNAWKQSH